MSREIKFRAWEKDKMEYGVCPCQIDYYNQGHEPDCFLMQYTGLKDKNGKKIYEGDILLHEDFKYRKQKVYGVMAWDETAAAFTSFYPLFQFEVIGNIYENPELMEAKNV